MEFIDIVIPIIILYIVISWIKRKVVSDLVYQTSSINGKKYIVRNLNDKQQAADYLATIGDRLSNFIQDIAKKYPANENVKRLQTKYNKDDISEGDYDESYTTYTLNKTSMVFCLRHRKDGLHDKLHDMNLIMFVAIHELAHIMSKTVSDKTHNAEFHENFLFLLKEAVRLEYYKPIDYSKYPETYCGVPVNDNPLFSTKK